MADSLVDLVVLLGIPALFGVACAALLVLLALILFHYLGKRRVEGLDEILYKKMRDLCRANADPRHRELWRSSVPYAPNLLPYAREAERIIREIRELKPALISEAAIKEKAEKI